MSACLSTRLLCLPDCLSLSLFVWIFGHRSACLSVSLPVCLFVCLSACLSICLSVCLPVCLSVCLCCCFSRYQAPTNSVALSFCIQATDNGDQFTLSTQLIKPNYLLVLPPTQHHSFFRKLPPLFVCLPVYLPICLIVCLSGSFPVCQSAQMPFCLTVCSTLLIFRFLNT